MKSNSENVRESLRQEQFAEEDQVSPRTPNSTKETAVPHQGLALDPSEKAAPNPQRVVLVELVETPDPTPQGVMVEIMKAPDPTPHEIQVKLVKKPKPTPQEVWVEIVEAPNPTPRTVQVIVLDSQHVDKEKRKV